MPVQQDSYTHLRVLLVLTDGGIVMCVQVPPPTTTTTRKTKLQRGTMATLTTCLVCEHDGCTRPAEGSTSYCFAHGDGDWNFCQHEGCKKAAQGKTPYCIAHGGGKRCKSEGCTKSAIGSTSFCVAHGGGGARALSLCM
jgi:hypothetical protein